MKYRWTCSNKSVYNIGYHFIWCTKYRKRVLTPKIESRLKFLLFEKAKKINVEIVSLETMPDHVHAFIKCSPIYAPHYVVGQLKGYTSRFLRKEFKELRSRIPSLWTRSYYCESVGHISERTVKKYIEQQKSN